ncbi:hypothetical protein S83_035614, partial [Arachis hypogaea]
QSVVESAISVEHVDFTKACHIFFMCSKICHRMMLKPLIMMKVQDLHTEINLKKICC